VFQNYAKQDKKKKDKMDKTLLRPWPVPVPQSKRRGVDFANLRFVLNVFEQIFILDLLCWLNFYPTLTTNENESDNYGRNF
jgi:hypothetical protein